MKKKHGKAGGGEDGDGAMTVFMCEECNAVFLSQDTLAVHILAEHMKQGFVGGPPLGGLTSDVKKEEAIGAPEAESVVEVMAESQGEGLPHSSEDMESESYPLHTVEHIVSISDPSMTDGKKFVTLVEPVTQTDEQQQMEQLSSESLTEMSAETATTDTLASDSNVVLETVMEVPQDSNMSSEEHHVGTVVGQGNLDNTYVTITDPNTNEEYTVSMPTNTIENLLAVSGSGELIGQDQYVAVAETVEIPIAHDTGSQPNDSN